MAQAGITQLQLEAHLTHAIVQGILDDNNDGEPDPNAVAAILEYATTYVVTRIEDVWPVTYPYPAGVQQIMLDAAEARAAQRHPEVLQRDWLKLWARVDVRLDALRAQKATTGDDDGTPTEPVEGIYVETDCRRGWR